ncbi:MAG: phosphoglycerate dehydrogenase [Opitutaceae bacterium]|nr:phosphoglycerate dehydrogenase [Opitutaceae bacterium]
MKILIADKISPKGVEFFRNQSGFEVVEAYNSSPAQILDLVKDVNAIIVRSETKITAEVLEAAPNLKVVGRAGVGVDNVDVEAATEKGVVVMNTPSGNTIATAELTFTHMLCGARPVPQAAASMKAGDWARKSLSGEELFKKKLGIIGMGRIGGEVAKRAQAFGMSVIAYDPYLVPSRAKAMEVESVGMDQLLAEADYITVHMPLTESTKYLIDEKAFDKMKEGVRIFNCARGGLIKESALIDALKNGKVAAAGLDVYEEEPLPAESELRQFDQVSLTPHLGASTKEAQESVGLEIAEAVTETLAGGVINNAVNMPSIDSQTLERIGPYLELGAKLGTFIQQISPTHIKKLHITYWGKVMDLDANSLTRSILKGFLQQISGESANFVNALVIFERLGIEVEVTKSSQQSDYSELVQIEAHSVEGGVSSISGTLIGTANNPRLVGMNGREVEANLNKGIVLVVENRDEPGVVGQIGTIIAKDKVNIATISMSRIEVGGVALTVVNLDSSLSEKVMQEIASQDAIERVLLVRL